MVCSAPGQAGEGEGNSFASDKERLALCLMRGASSLADSAWPLTTRAVDTSQQSLGQKGFGAAGMEGGTTPFQGEESHASRPPPATSHAHVHRDACPQLRAQRETTVSLGVERSPS